MPREPLLFVDIDGVISLFGFAPDARPAGRFESSTASPTSFRPRPASTCVDWPSLRARLVQRLGGEGQRFLPAPARAAAAAAPSCSFERDVGRSHAHWKLAAIEAYAGARPLAWIDDAHDEPATAGRRRARRPTLLVTTEPAIGLTDAGTSTRLIAWAAA